MEERAYYFTNISTFESQPKIDDGRLIMFGKLRRKTETVLRA